MLTINAGALSLSAVIAPTSLGEDIGDFPDRLTSGVTDSSR
ncbi:hypothetical protein [Streptomyces sp. NPDC094466]